MVMNRWLILGGYMLLTACKQLVWLSFASITPTRRPTTSGPA